MKEHSRIVAELRQLQNLPVGAERVFDVLNGRPPNMLSFLIDGRRIGTVACDQICREGQRSEAEQVKR